MAQHIDYFFRIVEGEDKHDWNIKQKISAKKVVESSIMSN